MRQHGLTANGELIVLQRFHGGVRCRPAQPDEALQRVLFVDVETTGLDPGQDRVIELAVCSVEVSVESGVVTRHRHSANWLEDPGRPLPPEIVALTGIRDRDVAGQRIPDAEVREIFAGAQMVVAHNARFDRAMCASRFDWIDAPGMPPWGCSLEQIDWRGLGHRHADLGSLARDHGFFFDAHRATLDVEALVKLLQFQPEVHGAPTYLAELLADSRRSTWAVAASGAPYEARGELRGRSYRWDPDAKHWWRMLRGERLDEEVEWLRELCIRHGSGRPIRAQVPFAERFADTFHPNWAPC